MNVQETEVLALPPTQDSLLEHRRDIVLSANIARMLQNGSTQVS